MAVEFVGEIGSRKLIAGLKVADGGTMERVKQRVELGLAFGTDVGGFTESSFASETRSQREEG